MKNKEIIGIIGLGYVGLPLAVEFEKKYKVIAFDIDKARIKELENGIDKTLEIDSENLKKLTNIKFTSNENELESVDVFIVTVPTPIDKYNKPDINILLSASKTVGRHLKKNNIVIYESTVYPGCTEEDCVPVLEKESNLTYNKDFFCGYSPERINPGDKIHTVTKIKKITSGSNEEVSEKIDGLYQSIITAGTYKAKSIKVAEAAKVIENAQRDINIAFVNELAQIFNKLNIDTNDVLDAASTKWNFLNFRPGLVGGHCIGVDPYYLAQKAAEVGHHPEIILSGRRVNDSMGKYVADEVVKLMIDKSIYVSNSKVLILGITFKENCPDIRNTKVIDIYNRLKTYKIKADIFDPWASPEEVSDEYGVELNESIPDKKYDAIILAVSHLEFKNLKVENLKAEKSILYDVKGFLNTKIIDGRL